MKIAMPIILAAIVATAFGGAFAVSSLAPHSTQLSPTYKPLTFSPLTWGPVYDGYGNVAGYNTTVVVTNPNSDKALLIHSICTNNGNIYGRYPFSTNPITVNGGSTTQFSITAPSQFSIPIATSFNADFGYVTVYKNGTITTNTNAYAGASC